MTLQKCESFDQTYLVEISNYVVKTLNNSNIIRNN